MFRGQILKQNQNVKFSLPLYKTETLDFVPENDSLPVHLKCINNVLRRKVSQNPTFGVYQNDTDCSYKTERSRLKYNDKHVFVDGKSYRVTPGL